MDFGIPENHREKKQKDRQILGLCQRTKKKQWNIRVTVISNVVGALGTVPSGFEKRLEKREIRRKIETVQTTAFSRSARILRRVLET